MTGVAQRIVLAAPTHTDRDHEAVRFDHVSVGQLDAYRPLDHHRTRGDDSDQPRLEVAHDFTARITTSSSSRRPTGSIPMLSIHRARALSTGPNGISCVRTTSARSPPLRRRRSERTVHRRTPIGRSASSRRRQAVAVPSRTAGRESGGRRRLRSMLVPARRRTGSAPGVRRDPLVRREDWTPPGRRVRRATAAFQLPTRASTATPAVAALSRAQLTARGQMSNAVTLRAPSWAAAIATTPLPVHRSSTRRPATSAVTDIASISKCESCCGAYTPAVATTESCRSG